MDHYLGQITALVTIIICSLLAQLSFVDHLVWLPILPMQDPGLPTPHRNRCRVSGQESFFSEVFSVTVLDGSRLQDWFPFI